MIYLDYNASAPLREGVKAAINASMDARWGNPSSVHTPGRAARQALDDSRRAVAASLRVEESQVLFTSGGTEANNHALLGLAGRAGWRGHVVMSAIEHPSVLEVGAALERRGMEVTRVKCGKNGLVAAERFLAALRSDTVVASLMLANNETGVVQPVAEVAVGCRQAGVPLHTDAVQALGKMPLDLTALGAALVTLSPHKCGGPRGVGVLVLDKRLLLDPLLVGGGHERGRRAGTENLPAIQGLAALMTELDRVREEENARILALRQLLETGLRQHTPDAILFGHEVERLPNTVAVGLPGIEGETLVMSLDLAGFAVSSGSACSSGKTEPSHVMRAMGMSEELGRGMIRVSLGWKSTADEVNAFVVAYQKSVDRLRRMG